jgi:outer membrane lipoprotein-sorting protein
MMTSTLLSFLILVNAQTPVNTPTDPKAMLDQMTKAYSTYQTLTMVCINSAHDANQTQSSSDASIKTNLLIQRPNLFRLEQTDRTGAQVRSTLVVSTGKKLYLPYGGQNIGREAPAEMTDMLRNFEKMLSDSGLPLMLILSPPSDIDRFYKYLSNLKTVTRQKIDTQDVDVINADYKNSKGVEGSMEFYIGVKDHLLRRLVVKVKAALIDTEPKVGADPIQTLNNEALIYEWNMRYTLNPKFEAGTFKAPPGALSL